MSRIRFLIDDEGQSRTQRAVLAAFAASLRSIDGAEVVWSSGIGALPYWEDVPAESARRLGLRLAALTPAAGVLTVFLPGHLVPGQAQAVVPTLEQSATLAADGFRTVADLDLFVVRNDQAELAGLQDLPDYEAASRYADLSSTGLPSWLAGRGLTSALLLHQRPWYSVHAPSRDAWLHWVAKACGQGLLTRDAVASDVREGLVRPSLLDEFAALSGSFSGQPAPEAALDALFIAPECRLSDQQLQLLHSEDLQRRTQRSAKRKAARKAMKEATHKSASYRLRKRLGKLARRVLGAFRAAWQRVDLTFRARGEPRSPGDEGLR